MSLAARLQSALGGSPTAAGSGATVTGDLRPGEFLGVNINILRAQRNRVAGEQWKAHQVAKLAPPKSITLRSVESNTLHDFPLQAVAKEISAGGGTMFKRISGPEELAEQGVYVEKGMLKPEYRTGEAIRPTFYWGKYAARADTLRAAGKSAAQASPQYATSALGPDAWLCPGYQRSPHLVVEAGQVDHRVPVAQHWTQLGGNNTDQDARKAFNLDGDNLQLLCESCNNGKSSKTMDGNQISYVDSVGPLFTGPDGKR